MLLNRRRSLIALLTLAGALGPLGASMARTRGKPRNGDDEDDDDERGIPNMFISPCGEPFRAAEGAPYPVAEWFRQADTNSDGKVDHAEFLADADRFFKRLDINGDGILSRYEIQVYEKKWVPEINGGTVTVGMNAAPARLWLAQYNPSGMQGLPGTGSPTGPGNPANTSIDPGGDAPDQALPPHPKGLDESGAGASPYSFFEEPEPIMAADFDVSGIITHDNFIKLADMHFTDLDPDQRGYLTLASLPKTFVEKLLERSHRIARRS